MEAHEFIRGRMSPFNERDLMTKLLPPSEYMCKHGHDGLAHRNCYLNYLSDREGLRVGYLDIETSQLNAKFGIIYSWAIKVKGEDTVLWDSISKEDYESGHIDKRVVSSAISALDNFDVIYTYYGTKFDIPFLRTRAMKWKLRFPFHKQLYHQDLYYSVRNKMKLESNRLKSACAFLGIKGKTELAQDYWIRAMYGDLKALRYIVNHNVKDVEILEKLHERIRPYIQFTQRSI